MNFFINPEKASFRGLKWIAGLFSFVGSLFLLPCFFMSLPAFMFSPSDYGMIVIYWFAGPVLFALGQIIHLLIAIWGKLSEAE